MQYWNTITNRVLLLAFIGSLSSFYTFAQENSPYSRYGLGNTKLIENAANRGMGGVSIADDNGFTTNPTNPATFASLKLTSFQIAVEGLSVNVRNSTLSNRTGSLGLAYVNLGFPLTKKLGVSFGLMPQTRSKYGMSQTDDIDLDSVKKVNHNYYGGGGTQKLYIGAAYKYKQYSVGFSTGYMFGSIVNSSEAIFSPDSFQVISSSVTSRTTVGGIFLQLGALMNHTLKEKYHFSLGASYQLSQKLNAKKDSYWKSYIGSVTEPDYQYNVDSIIEKKGKVVIPGKLSLGAMFSKEDKWKLGADFITSNWSNYRTYEQADSTGNSWTLKIGGAITPDASAIGQTWKRITYRLGAYTGKDIFKFQGTSLPVNGVTAGLGYPIRRTNLSIGQINASIDVGKRGTTSNGLLSEGYTRFTIGFTFNDKWFIPRKYE